MGTAHEETGHSHPQRAAAQPPFSLGQTAGGGSKVGAAAYAAQAGFEPRDWMLPPPRSPWKRRVGAGVVTGLLGVLGWVAFKQLPSNSVNAATQATGADEETRIAASALSFDDFDDLGDAKSEPVKDALKPAGDRPAAAGNPFTNTAAQGRTAEAAPARFEAPAPRSVAAEDDLADEDENPFGRESAAQRGATAANKSQAAPFAAVKAEFQTSAAAVTLVQPASTIAADFGEEPTEPEDDVSSEPFAFTPAAAGESAGKSAAATVQLIEAEDEFEAPAQDEFAFDLSEEAPAAATASPPRAPAGAAFQFAEEDAEPAAEVEFEAAPPGESDSPPATAAEDDLGGFSFDAPAQQPAVGSGPGLEFEAEPEPVPAEEAAAPRSFAAPVEPQEITRATALANNPKDEKVHIVQPGENYWSIARQHYSAGRYFSALAEYNKPRISEAKQLKPGMKVLIPSAGTLEKHFAKIIQPGGPGAGKPKRRAGLFFEQQQAMYCVGEKDTLGTISQRHLGRFSRWSEIYDLNRDQLKTPDALKLGMILKMPADASELATAAALPANR